MKTIFIRLLAAWVVIWAEAFACYAQDNTNGSVVIGDNNAKDRDIYFVYIDHEPNTPEYALVEKLDELHKNALDYNSVLVIFLANEDDPLISFTNMKDPDPNQHRDDNEAYIRICNELQTKEFHEATANDMNAIVKMFGPAGTFPLFDDTDEEDPMLYKTTKMMFFVGQMFWFRGLNETLIAQLYTALNISKYIKLYRPTQFGFEIWRPKDKPLPNEELGSYRFGRHNRGGINDNQKIKFYSYPN